MAEAEVGIRDPVFDEDAADGDENVANEDAMEQGSLVVEDVSVQDVLNDVTLPDISDNSIAATVDNSFKSQGKSSSRYETSRLKGSFQ